MADYDLAANIKPLVGTDQNVIMDGTTATAEIDTVGWKSLTFVANLNIAAEHNDVAWALTHSDESGTGYVDVDADDVLVYPPADQTELSRMFHAGYRGKKRYVKAALDSDNVTAAEAAYTEADAADAEALTSSSTTATLEDTAHGLVVGQYVTIAGADQAAYNGTFRIASVPDADSFTYTMGSDPVDTATGTITYVARTYWDNDPGADIPASFTPGANAQTGTYHLTVSNISSASAVGDLTLAPANTGDGTVTLGAITAAGANAIFGETLRIVCTAEAGNAGTFTVYREDGTSIGTITVGGGSTTIQVGGVNAFAITIADGTNDWDVDDLINLTIRDLGVNRYVLTAPDATVVGYPLGGVAFSTGSHLTFTVPDTTVAVSEADADLSITVTEGLCRGQLTAILGHPISGPVNQAALEDSSRQSAQ